MQYILFAVKPVQSVVQRWAPDANRTDYEQLSTQHRHYPVHFLAL